MSDQHLRTLERWHAQAPDDLGVLRALADERKRLGLELLPDVRRPNPISEFLQGAMLSDLILRLGPDPDVFAWYARTRAMLSDLLLRLGPDPDVFAWYARTRAAFGLFLPYERVVIQ